MSRDDHPAPAPPDQAGDPDGPGGASRPAVPDALPMPVFQEFLRRLHSGPPQHAAAVRVALAVWQTAVQRGDVEQARQAVGLVRGALDRVIGSLTDLQETGRRWAGGRPLTHEELAAAARMAADWDAARHGPPDQSEHGPPTAPRG